MNKPLLSIVIANYNYGRFLEAAIRSVVEQDGFDQCELIVVDGGSADNSVDVIKKYEDNIAWWVSEKDKGQSDAFNKGFAHAKGKFGCWVNADDVLLPGTLKYFVKYCEANPKSKWIGAGMVWVKDDLTIFKCSRNTTLPLVLQRISPGYIVGGPSSFFDLSILKELGGFDVDFHYAMDNDLWLRMMDYDIKLDIMPCYVWVFRMHEASKTTMNLLPHDISRLSSERLWDGQQLLARYNKHMRHERFVSKLIMLYKLIKGTYLKSLVDTLRFKGKKVWEVFK